MTAPETAYTEIERLVKSFKDMPATQQFPKVDIFNFKA